MTVGRFGGSLSPGHAASNARDLALRRYAALDEAPPEPPVDADEDDATETPDRGQNES